MSYAGGSVEHWNKESGEQWLARLLQHFQHVVWLNPQPQQNWPYYHSIGMMQQIMENRMYPLTLYGINDAIKNL